MYCTGGIRCEYFSAALKAQGWKKVAKLTRTLILALTLTLTLTLT